MDEIKATGTQPINKLLKKKRVHTFSINWYTESTKERSIITGHTLNDMNDPTVYNCDENWSTQTCYPYRYTLLAGQLLNTM